MYMVPAHPRTEADSALLEAMLSVQRCMMSTGLTGDTDRDFVLTMLPFYQAEIGMASVEVKFGKNAAARGFAQSIIYARSKDIGELSKWLKPRS
jgi:uncharacterized protein (DUF305 family)